jgi:predicted TIM-barrel fold metal-dependent hydrolase
MSEIIDINTFFGPHPAATSDLSVDDLIGLMHKHSVKLCCTLSTIGLLLDHNAGNSTTRSACADSDSLAPVATINPIAFFGGESKQHSFKTDGFKMVRFFPWLQDWDSEFAPFKHVASVLSADKIALMVDLNRTGMATHVVESLRDYDAPIILAGITDRMLSEAIVLMRSRSNIFVETSALLATGAIKLAAESVGAERLLYGSGAPARPMASGLAALKYSGLTEDQKSLVLGGNARRVLVL